MQATRKVQELFQTTVDSAVYLAFVLALLCSPGFFHLISMITQIKLGSIVMKEHLMTKLWA